MLEFLQFIDEKIFFVINGLHNQFFDRVMWWISGKYTWIPFYLIILGILIYRFRIKALIYILFIIVLITASDQGSVHLFKNVFERLRPSHNPDLQNMVHLVNGYRGGKFGFISSHAANSFALVSFLAPVIKKKWFILLLFLWAILICYSRIYLGVHYPFDIIVGGAFGGILGYGFFKIHQFLTIKTPDSEKD